MQPLALTGEHEGGAHTERKHQHHQPGDEAPKINYEKTTDISRAAFLNMWNLANVENY